MEQKFLLIECELSQNYEQLIAADLKESKSIDESKIELTNPEKNQIFYEAIIVIMNMIPK